MTSTSFDRTLPVAIGCDHAGFEYKEKIAALLREQGWTLQDHGAYSTESVDYPDMAHPVAKQVAAAKAAFGILICGSGNGVAITANKEAQVRAALCWEQELAKLARAHNNANIICIPARFVSEQLATQMVLDFIATPFEGGRHQNRVNKIAGC
ncbi:MAG: ribose 5-phosphate isomerase B [Sphingomonadales bacterium]|nr:ribose 5-phosphate isomerase B [Sphingomonadales bacterium]